MTPYGSVDTKLRGVILQNTLKFIIFAESQTSYIDWIWSSWFIRYMSPNTAFYSTYTNTSNLEFYTLNKENSFSNLRRTQTQI